MLPSQRDLFDLPRDVVYLNAASMGLLPRATLAALPTMADRKGRPWLTPDFNQAAATERARRAAAALIHADPGDVAHMPSVGLAVAQVGRLLALPRGSRVLVMADDHASPVFEWQMRAARGGFAVETVPQPADGDWTGALLAAIERPGAAPLALLSVSTLHWTEGCVIDAAAVTRAAKQQGAAVLLDATQSIGVMDLDVGLLDPDFVTFVCYKWLLGPYGRSFLYVAKRHQDGIPLDQTMSGRRNVKAEAVTYFADTRYVDNARRFDIGQRDAIISMDTASIGMELVSTWGVAAVAQRLSHLMGLLATAVSAIPGLEVTPKAHRTPHILGVKPRGGPMPPAVATKLAAQGVHAAIRIGRLRLAPHVYNDEEDIARAAAALRGAVA